VVGLALAAWAVGQRPAPARASGALEPPPERLVVEVLNGTDRDGLARRTTRWLRSRGLDVIAYGNAEASATTRLLVRRGPASRGYEARRALGLGEVELAVDTMLRVDVTVILGEDFTLPADAPPF